MPSGDNSPKGGDGRRPILTGSNLKRAIRGRPRVALFVEIQPQRLLKNQNIGMAPALGPAFISTRRI